MSLGYHALPLDLTVPQIRKLMTGKGIIIKPKSLVGSGIGHEGDAPSRGVVVHSYQNKYEHCQRGPAKAPD
jgi:hypothetical protein